MIKKLLATLLAGRAARTDVALHHLVEELLHIVHSIHWIGLLARLRL